MPRPLYPEHTMLPIPDSLKLCIRCKQGLIFKPNNADPYCMKCGDGGRPGEIYVRVGLLEEKLNAPVFEELKELWADADDRR